MAANIPPVAEYLDYFKFSFGVDGDHVLMGVTTDFPMVT